MFFLRGLFLHPVKLIQFWLFREKFHLNCIFFILLSMAVPWTITLRAIRREKETEANQRLICINNKCHRVIGIVAIQTRIVWYDVVKEAARHMPNNNTLHINYNQLIDGGNARMKCVINGLPNNFECHKSADMYRTTENKFFLPLCVHSLLGFF